MRLQPAFWRKCRICFRWCRITALFAVLVMVCAFVWLNRIGLPDFLKTRLVEALHSRGIQLEFSRMRMRVTRGLVVENVRVGDARIPDNPTFSVGEVQLQLDFRALLRRRLEIKGLVLRQGKLVWRSRRRTRWLSTTSIPTCVSRSMTPGRSTIFRPTLRAQNSPFPAMSSTRRKSATGNFSRGKNPATTAR